MKLVEEGKIRLDDPIRKYLDWFGIEKMDERAPEVTMRHALTHTTGFPRDISNYYADFDYQSMEEFIDWQEGLDPVYNPGTKWKYSNLGFVLGAAIVEELSGLSYEQYVQNANI